DLNGPSIPKYRVLGDFAPHRTGTVRLRRKIACGLVLRASCQFPQNPKSDFGGANACCEINQDML
ncbi:MAG: hypothetical protein WBK96_13230, partial [Candidatus Manganitrophaceae bacterium]